MFDIFNEGIMSFYFSVSKKREIINFNKGITIDHFFQKVKRIILVHSYLDLY